MAQDNDITSEDAEVDRTLANGNPQSGGPQANGAFEENNPLHQQEVLFANFSKQWSTGLSAQGVLDRLQSFGQAFRGVSRQACHNDEFSTVSVASGNFCREVENCKIAFGHQQLPHEVLQSAKLNDRLQEVLSAVASSEEWQVTDGHGRRTVLSGAMGDTQVARSHEQVPSRLQKPNTQLELVDTRDAVTSDDRLRVSSTKPKPIAHVPTTDFLGRTQAPDNDEQNTGDTSPERSNDNHNEDEPVQVFLQRGILDSQAGPFLQGTLSSSDTTIRPRRNAFSLGPFREDGNGQADSPTRGLRIASPIDLGPIRWLGRGMPRDARPSPMHKAQRAVTPEVPLERHGDTRASDVGSASSEDEKVVECSRTHLQDRGDPQHANSPAGQLIELRIGLEDAGAGQGRADVSLMRCDKFMKQDECHSESGKTFSNHVGDTSARVVIGETHNNRDRERQYDSIISYDGDGSPLTQKPRSELPSSALTMSPEHLAPVGTAPGVEALAAKQDASIILSEPDFGGIMFKTVQWGSPATVTAVNDTEEQRRGRILLYIKKKVKRLCRRVLKSNNTG